MIEYYKFSHVLLSSEYNSPHSELTKSWVPVLENPNSKKSTNNTSFHDVSFFTRTHDYVTFGYMLPQIHLSVTFVCSTRGKIKRLTSGIKLNQPQLKIDLKTVKCQSSILLFAYISLLKYVCQFLNSTKGSPIYQDSSEFKVVIKRHQYCSIDMKKPLHTQVE